MRNYLKFIFSFLMISNCVAQELTAVQKIPETIIPGGTYIAEITVNRTAATGFMKFSQNVPAGSIATEIDSKGGSFSFADSTAKIIWIIPPEEKQFIISYRVNIPKNVSGNKNINGKIAYLLGDERKSLELETKTIKVSDDMAAAKTESAPVAIVTSPPIVSPPVKDTIPKEEEKKVLVTEPVVIKEEEKIAPPPPVEEVKKEEPIILPPPVVVEEKKVEQPPAIEPVKEEKKVAPVELVKKEEPIVSSSPVVVTEKKGEPSPVIEPAKEEKKAAPVNNFPLKSTIPVTAIPSSSGKTFRVQIGAFNLKPEIKGVPALSKVVLENGMTKYFSGNFPTYEAAAKHKKLMIEKGFQGAFIVSFENGKIVR